MRVAAMVLVSLVMAFLVFCGPAMAQETGGGSAIVTRAVGNDDLFKIEAGYRPGLAEDRTEIGLYGIWIDGVNPAEVEALGGGVYGTYDVMHQQEFKIPGTQVAIPATLYVGAMLGAIDPEGSGWDATAGLMSGLSFGDKAVRLGIRFEYFLTKSFWKELADIPDDARLLATIEYRFGKK